MPANARRSWFRARPQRIGWARLPKRVFDRHAALPELRRPAKDHRGHPRAASHREDPHPPGAGSAAAAQRPGARGGTRRRHRSRVRLRRDKLKLTKTATREQSQACRLGCYSRRQAQLRVLPNFSPVQTGPGTSAGPCRWCLKHQPRPAILRRTPAAKQERRPAGVQPALPPCCRASQPEGANARSVMTTESTSMRRRARLPILPRMVLLGDPAHPPEGGRHSIAGKTSCLSAPRACSKSGKAERTTSQKAGLWFISRKWASSWVTT